MAADQLLTVVTAFAESFDRSGSNSLALMDATSLIRPGSLGVTTMVTVADFPGASFPRSHETFGPPTQDPVTQ